MENDQKSSEHILVCLSSSPSNQKVISEAAEMAEAFHAELTAVYVRRTDRADLSNEDKTRLQDNMKFCEQHGAAVSIITGDDTAAQIAEFARACGATKIVVGRSGAKRRSSFSKASLTEQIIINAPEIDVFIIPDSAADIQQYKEKIRRSIGIRPTGKDAVITVLILIAATIVGLLFSHLGFSEANVITVYILGILIISVITVSPVFGTASSLASVLLFNYFFIEPKFSFHTYETEYTVTFAIMLISSLITGRLANRFKHNASNSAREAYRIKMLFDTNRLLQKAGDADEAVRITANQMMLLLNRDIVIYPAGENGEIGDDVRYSSDKYIQPEHTGDDEKEIVRWVFRNREPAGGHMEHYSSSQLQYYPLITNDRCFGVVGINLNGNPLEPFEYSVFTSIMGECALTLQSIQNAAEKERAAVIARNEQLRANLLRSISHDIRTPLTSISGNASNLLNHYNQLDDATLKQTFSDIYDDSEWMIDLVENLLSISRIENGELKLNLSADMINDVIEEALNHVDRRASEHSIINDSGDDYLLVRMDARLIMQVLINLVNNAVKNTQTGSEIRITCVQKEKHVEVSVSDNGPGIPDEVKPHIFEMFYTGPGKIADGRRGLGLGLALCKSIVEAHGGSISLTDNEPTGCRFTFTLPVVEVNINE